MTHQYNRQRISENKTKTKKNTESQNCCLDRGDAVEGTLRLREGDRGSCRMGGCPARQLKPAKQKTYLPTSKLPAATVRHHN